ncbi:tetratricopeptide repeat protein [Lentzea tibetensis]|uniref:Tetratricopeptide repeat protein n=1 Tax=Lentzea tibetensis TaxID=2591470 RepID=A0A563ERN1_9PSEU|nr:tetratricopeptide repeat protein [Lentzea tibetensis]
MLCALLLDANELVGPDRLAELAWGLTPPSTARAQIDICVSALRRALDQAGADARIEARRSGYALHVAPELIDITLFDVRVAESRAAAMDQRWDDAAALLRSALALWRGPAFGGALPGEVRRFDEKRLRAQEDRVDVDLQLGRHHALVAELRALVAEHPLRERPRGQLMLALYRSGRQSEALDVYRAGRHLGLEPGDRLRELEVTIRLDRENTEPVAGGPRQLPADVGGLVGRDDLVAELERLLTGERDTTPVVNLVGEPGMGKTALAVHVAHRVAYAFPDGQLFCDLSGTNPAEVLGRFTSAFGAVGSTLPDGLDERAEMFRSMLANRRVLLVLDDAATASQFAALLPGSAACGVIVTSRVAVGGTHHVEVGPLSPADSLRVLDRPELVEVAAGVPLALRLLGGCPQGTVPRGDVLTLADEGLEPEPRRALRLMSALDGDSLPRWAATAVSGGFDPLKQLVDARLLDVTGSDVTGLPRYRFHGVVRSFARDRVLADEARTAFERVAGGWLALAERAHQRLYGGAFTILHGSATRWRPHAPYVDQVSQDPMGWLDSERANLCAAVFQAADLGLDELCWDLAVTLVTLFETRCYLDDWQLTHDRALAAVRKAGNRRGTAAVLCSLGSLHISRRRGEQARAVLEPALELFGELHDTHGLAMARRNLGVVEYREGRPELATRMFELSLTGFERVGDVVGQAYVVSQLAQLSLDRGEYDLAVGRLREALVMCRDIRSPRVESQVLYRLGSAMLLQGRYEQAQQLMTSVLGMVRRSGDTVGESYALHSLGLISGRLRMFTEAGRSLRRAIRLCEANLDRVGAARIRLDLAQLVSQQGETFDAVAIAEQAMTTFQELRLSLWESRTFVVLDKIRAENRVRVAGPD